MSTEPEAIDTEREPTTWTLAPDEFAATKNRAAKISARAISAQRSPRYAELWSAMGISRPAVRWVVDGFDLSRP
ncbi:hypothetical protein GCM10027064_20150 [Microbacterium petrolearium]